MDGEMSSQSVKKEKQTLEEDYVRQRQNFMQHMVEADGKRQGVYNTRLYKPLWSILA